jgi:hypothetical protein
MSVQKKNLSLEILIHLVDSDGKRNSPSCNRITIPLQVKEITPLQSITLPLAIENAVASVFVKCESLQELVRKANVEINQEKQSDIALSRLLQLVYRPILDCIEIPEIQHNVRNSDRILCRELQSDQNPDDLCKGCRCYSRMHH